MRNARLDSASGKLGWQSLLPTNSRIMSHVSSVLFLAIMALPVRYRKVGHED